MRFTGQIFFPIICVQALFLDLSMCMYLMFLFFIFASGLFFLYVIAQDKQSLSQFSLWVLGPSVSYGGFNVMELLKNLRSSGTVPNIDRYKVCGNVKTISVSLTQKCSEKSFAALKTNFKSLWSHPFLTINFIRTYFRTLNAIRNWNTKLDCKTKFWYITCDG